MFSVRVEGAIAPDAFNVALRYKPVLEEEFSFSESFIRLEMPLGDGALDDYEVYLTQYPRGDRIVYYIEVEDTSGVVLATLPESGGPKGELLPFQFRGIPQAWIVIVRTSCIFGALLAATLALLTALGLKRQPEAISFLGKAILWAAMLLLSGGVVFEIVFTRAVIGGLGWGGWPIGEFDFAHTMTEVALLFWIALTTLLKGSALTGRAAGNLVSIGTARLLTLTGYVLILAVYFIPRQV
ncbi:MAG: hypothetical protein KAT85_02980 [candidate division Zixibacteria bacterium]|nr:hypothetical protein [candidate division Zixibacteria bacterium]